MGKGALGVGCGGGAEAEAEGGVGTRKGRVLGVEEVRAGGTGVGPGGPFDREMGSKRDLASGEGMGMQGGNWVQ